MSSLVFNLHDKNNYISLIILLVVAATLPTILSAPDAICERMSPQNRFETDKQNSVFVFKCFCFA